MSNDTKPLVTIGIPTYNRAHDYLTQAVESALNQTYPHIEVFISDNGSTDNTEAVIHSYSDPRLRYFKHEKNIPVNDNFNYCLEQARGDYFILLHDDDVLDGDFVEACMEAAGYRTNVGVIRTGTHVIDAQGNRIKDSLNRVGGLPLADYFVGWFNGKASWYFCSTLFNAHRLKEIGGFDAQLPLFQDGIAISKLAARFGHADVHDAKASFRQHGATRTAANKVSAWCRDSSALLDAICGLVPPEKASWVRREGARYFARINYGFAGTIPSRRERWNTYLLISRTFGYRYSPLYFFVYRKGRRRFFESGRKAKRTLKQLLAPKSS